MIPASLQVTQVADARLDCLEVGKHAAKPAMIHVEHTAALGLFSHSFLGLFLRAYKKDSFTIGSKLFHKLVRLIETPHCLLQIHDMDAIAIHKDEGLHFGVPATGLMSEVYARF